MKKLFTLLLTFTFISGFAQNVEMLIPFLKGGKYGYRDTKNTIVIKAKYDKALPFYEDYDLTITARNNSPNIINRKGKVVLKSNSDYFDNDSVKGIRIFSPEMMERIAIKDFCQVKPCPEFAIIKALARRSVFDKMNNLYFVKNQKAYLIDKNGKKKTDYYDKIKHYDYGEIEYCITEDHLNQKEGLLDENGLVLLECVYDKIIYKGKGVFTIKQGSIKRDFKVKTKPYEANKINNQTIGNYRIKRKNNKSGVVDANEQIVIQYIYDKLYPLHNNKFIFWKGNEVGILDIDEKYVFTNKIPFKFPERSKQENQVPYTVFNKNHVFFNVQNKWCLVNLKGKQVGDKYDGIFIDFQNIAGGIAGVVVDKKLGVINNNGQLILNPLYDQIYCLEEDDSFVVKTQEKWNWYDSKGKIIYENFDDFGYQLKNHLLVFKDGKWFYVGNNGTVFKD